MKNKIIWSTFTLIFLSLLLFWYFNARDYKLIEINGQKFKVETARTLEEKFLGLGQRKDIKNNRGMLFIFPESGEYIFWMKEMRFDLDIIWINDGKIVFIKKNASHNSLELINPGVKADQVLEIINLK